MIRRIVEKDYEYKHALGTIVTTAEVGVSDKGHRSLAKSEIDRLSRLVAIQFLKANYHKSIFDPEFSISSREARSIIALLGVNQDEFGALIGCGKSKVSKIVNNIQKVSKSQAQLALEHLRREISQPGSIRKIFDAKNHPTKIPDLISTEM